MTRLRVHELAKELNIDNKGLIERIEKLGFPVKNHMSPLSESAVLKIRQQFSEAKLGAEKIEEKRIGREVIRRRKKIDSQPEPEAPQAMATEEIPSETVAEILEQPPVEIAPQVAIQAGPSEEVAEVTAETPPLPEEIEPVETVEPAETVEEVEAAETVEPVETVAEFETAPAVEAKEMPDKVKPAVHPERKFEAARIVKPAPVKEEPVVAPPVVKEVLKPAAKAQPVASPPSPPPVGPAAREVTPAAVDVPKTEEEEEDDDKGRKKGKKRRRKKAKREEPARIIKLPELIGEEPEEEQEPDLTELAARFIAKGTEVVEPAAKEQKRKKPEEAEKAKPGRRKEVFQKEDLYSKKELAAQDDRGRSRSGRQVFKEPPKPEPVVQKVGRKRIKIDEAISVANLAKQMGMKAGEVLKKLLLLGLQANINQALDFDTAALVAADFEFEVEKTAFEEEEVLQIKEDLAEELLHRPPVVTVMGHVDHGKTSLLDAIRDTKVIEGEAGGITQHIGAYHVKLDKGHIIFLDTPGHEAFTSMRARGAKVTDIVILVVAADDGVMQQTVEAINHAKAAEVPIIVAINKIDKPNANIDRVKRELSDHGLVPEEWGGPTTMVEISAKKRIGIEDLLEMVLLQAELLELKANPNKMARGRVIEAKLDKGRGPVATVLIQDGTLKAGDVYVCGIYSGRVRNMFDGRGHRVDKASPSIPVEVLGFSGVPNAGDDFIVLADEKQARNVAEHRLLKLREKELSRTSKISLENLFTQIQDGEVKELKLIVKTDVQGSLEAIVDSLLKLSTSEVRINIIHNGTGAITETDVMLASASNAIIIGFNIRSDSKVQELSDQESVDIRYYDVIYQLLDDIRSAIVGMLKPIYKENVLGRAEVRQTFHVPKLGMIAGCSVLDGHVERNARARVLRDNVVVYDGKISSLRRFKDDVKEVKSGFECGIGIENFNDIKEKDILEAYEMQEIKQVYEPEHDRRQGS
ncbi:MAG: translation initiation factor IF-2 [Syntrophobacteraceae bacterium]|nr:translation initiation factor IF-2 [Syntrophobacteraceae bacterium]